MRRLLLSYFALLALLATTVAASFLPLGNFALPVSVSIACAKAMLIMLFFMQLRRATSLTRLAAGAGFVWLAILLALSAPDFLARKQETITPDTALPLRQQSTELNMSK